MNLTEAVGILADQYPKVNKPALSMALRSDDFGITLTPKARQMLYGRKEEKRTRQFRLTCRCNETRYKAVKRCMKEICCPTVQDFLDYLLDQYIPREYEEPPTTTNE